MILPKGKSAFRNIPRTEKEEREKSAVAHFSQSLYFLLFFFCSPIEAWVDQTNQGKGSGDGMPDKLIHKFGALKSVARRSRTK